MKQNYWIVALVLAGLIVLEIFSRPGSGVTRPLRGPAPAWSMADLNGKNWSASDFTGRTVVLNFWATWCPPCIAEIADLAQFSKQHDTNRIVVIGASVDEMPSDGLLQNVQALKIPYPVLRVTPEVAHAFGNVQALPTTFVIGPDGAFVAQHVGLITRKQLDAIVAPLLR